MNREAGVGAFLVAGVGLAGALGGGLLFVPERVGPVVGPPTPLTFLVAGGAIACVSAAFAVLASGPFGAGTGLVYRAVSRTWGSRTVGVAAAWPSVAAYVALLALVANWLGHLGVLPAGTRTLGTGFGGTDAGSAVELLVGPLPSLPPGPLAALACLLALGVHLLGARRAMLAVAVPVWALLGGATLALALAFVPGVGEFVPANYDPLFPTSDLRARALPRFIEGVGIALFAFVGVDAAASVGDGGTDERPVGILLATATLTFLTALATFVSLGVVNWIRLTQAGVPTADAVAAYLPLDPGPVTALVGLVFAWTALVALGFPASRTLAGFAELVGPDPPVDPVTAGLVLAYGGAAAICLFGVLAPAVYLAVPGLAVAYLAVVVTAAALSHRSPDRWAECSIRPGPRLRAALAVGGGLAALSILAVPAIRDPATVLSWTLHRVELVVLGFDLVRDPLASAVPALLAWELLGVGVLFVLRDYRDANGITLPPLSGSGREP
ncbi:hypothetical protein [Halorarum halobium]|uniref:hypothetical protein n=1 Tax=Halorarum halobium TaxID=3075121 RepID=UPI0028A9B55F|nr:hypothetical protein [Halobaculum sp. XH14]